MNFGRGFPIPQENGIVQNRDSWTPVTPGKPIPLRSDKIPVNMQKNQVSRGNWQDLVGMYSELLQDAPDLSAAVQNSNPTGATAQNRRNQNCNVGMDHNEGIRSCNVGIGQTKSNQTCYMGVGQSEGIQNAAVGMTQNGSNQNCYVGVGQNRGIQKHNVGMRQIGGDPNGNVGLGQNGGNRTYNKAMGQNGGNPSFSVSLGQNGGNRTYNKAMGQNGGNKNGGIRNCNAVIDQNGSNQNFSVCPTQGNPCNSQYSSSCTNTVRNSSTIWSNGLLARLLEAKANAASVGLANEALNRSINARNGPLAPTLPPQVESNSVQLETACSMVGKQDQTASSSRQIRGCNLQLLPVDGFPVPYLPSYDLNSPARSEVDVTTSIASSLQYAPVTPDKGKLLEDHQFPQEVNCALYGSSSTERNEHGHMMVPMRSLENEDHCNELLQNIVNSSSSVVSTTLQENHVLDAGDDREFDLNKTPQQKTPKRRKHRPKVVIEGKPKRTPKPKAPENSISNGMPSGKRKYVRKNGLKNPETQKPNDVGEEHAKEGPQDVGKRKYVRKKSLKTPETQQVDTVEKVGAPAVEPAAKSCRRALNFDLETAQNGEIQDNTDFNQIEKNQGISTGFNLNFDPQDTEQFTEINPISGASAVQIGQQNGYIAGTSNLKSPPSSMLLGNSLLPQVTPPTPPLAKVKAHALNAIARNVTMRSSVPGQITQLNEYSQVDRHTYGEGIRQIYRKPDAARANFDRAREPMLQSSSPSFTKDMPNVDEKRGLKRQSIEQISPHALNEMRSRFMYQKMLMATIVSDDNSHCLDSSCMETHKKKKMRDGSYVNHSDSPPGNAAGKDCPRREERETNGVNANGSISKVFSSFFGRDSLSDKVTSAGNMTTGNSYFHPMAARQNIQRHHVSSELQPYTKRMSMNRTQGSCQVHDFNSLAAMSTLNQLPTTPLETSLSNRLLCGTDQILQQQHNNAVEDHRHLPTTPPKEAPKSDRVQGIRTYQANVLDEKQTTKPCSANPGIDKILEQQPNSAVEGHQPSSTKARGTPRKQKFVVSVDEITYRLEGLSICGDSKEQHALVPYKGENSIVQYEPKKRKPRPKVDLDPESDRLWRFLMGKDGSEGEAMDKDKEKWWEEERAVFRGRADSFIARMHLVQGDRRFSRWKGSVVDSVIGVFLTQNVSDHLSSSAFMSLASKYPPQSTTIGETCCQNGTKVLVEEPDIQILEQIDSIKCNEKIGRQTLFNHSSIVASESTEDRRHVTSGVSDAANKHNKIMEEELLSQDSVDSFVFQTTDEQRSSSGSNSEAEDQTTGCKPNNNPGSTSMNVLHAGAGGIFEGFYSHVNGSTLLAERSKHMRNQSDNQEFNWRNPRFIGLDILKSASGFSRSIDSNIHHMQESLSCFSEFQLEMTPDLQKLGEQYGGMSTEESLPSLPSTGSAVTEVYRMSERTYQQSEMRIPQAATSVKYRFLGKHPTRQGSSQRENQIGNSAYSINNHHQQNSETLLQLEREFVKEPIGPPERLSERETNARKQGSDNPKFRGADVNSEDRMSVVDKQNRFKNAATEANSKEQTHSSHDPLSVAATNNVKTRKGKVEDEKKRAFDWDSLRKQVLLNGERERSKDAVDSLNYEALRCADVKEISDAIRERGMNNMLAERMKEFLNRLVRDHGSIDLEWLRDVPPDKAKDYLLSIRGLGLKSVECVRLLTLHHLAFPVDTNVGRIAVRLGWVPLQPLPESLQLHLLELYPVLETIQKYLWPRLCKLDQPTLYELHYQMITFGKVFCTKSKPNCNACPMRAECRHFASAFASARLALPGPEETGIVSSAVPLADERKPKVEIKPLALPPAEINSCRDAGLFDQRCEPIIEEPSTPDSEATISERDIEESYYEDPDEIPTIKLNMEEFSMNLHNLMQDNMELQGDMSKALVALNPEAASIPTPKLKNISRLRTEHQVYELPDSHPLLDRLDRREPDDPSPYLLAIWTPGETANSVQPPENTCQAQESGNLCHDNTCFSCNSTREANSQTVRGTLLVPCRTAMRGSFPLNGTYFQVNEMFADHESSLTPIDVPRSWLWNLPRRTVFFGTSVSTIFKGLTTEEIQFCFWRGFVCVRGFDQQTRAPRPLMARLHFPASRLVKKKDERK